MLLPVNYLDDILAASMNGKRRFKITHENETVEEVTIEDVTVYEQVGSVFGAKDINETNETVNQLQKRGTNNNLLINSNFANPVNQRGSWATRTNGYWIDHWKTSFAKLKGTADITENSRITLYNSVGETYVDIHQLVEFPEQYKGKTFTLSCRYRASGGNPYLQFVYTKDSVSSSLKWIDLIADGEWHTSSMTFTVPSDLDCNFIRGCQISLSCGENENHTISIAWAKLEEGEHATPYVPRLYAEELALCKRYYYTTYSSLGGTGYLAGISENGQSLVNVVEFPVEMRVRPTVTIKSPTDGSVGYINEWSTAKKVGDGKVGVNVITNKQFFVTASEPVLTKGLAYYFSYEADAELED